MNFLRDDEVQRLLSAALSLRFQAIIRILVNTGIRTGELAGLNVEDVDFEGKQLFILDSKKKRRVAVPVDSKTLELIHRHVGSRRMGPLFLSQLTHGRITDQSICKGVRRAAVRAGIRKVQHVTPRTLRHTFSINWIRANGDIETLRRILRHNRLTTTQKYLDFDDGRILSEYERIVEAGGRGLLAPALEVNKPGYII